MKSVCVSALFIHSLLKLEVSIFGGCSQQLRKLTGKQCAARFPCFADSNAEAKRDKWFISTATTDCQEVKVETKIEVTICA